MPLPVAFASQHVDFTVTLCGFPRVEIPYVQLQFESLSAFWIVAFRIPSASVARPVCMFECFAAIGITQLMY